MSETTELDDLPQPYEVTFTISAVNFLNETLFAVPCAEERAGHMIANEGIGCSQTDVIPFVDGVATITTQITPDVQGMCWGVGDITGTETSFICLPITGRG